LTSLEFTSAIRDFRPTKIIHLAATLRGVPDEQIFWSNVKVTASLLNSIPLSDAEMLLFASSGGVYGHQEQFPIEEIAIVQPLDVYSRSKVACEDLVRQFSIRSGIPTTIARIFNVCGPGQDQLHLAGRLANQLAAIMAQKSQPVLQIGSPGSTRDFIDVRDVCGGLEALLVANYRGVCNVASGSEISVGGLLEIFLDCSGLKDIVQVNIDTARIDRVCRHVADVRRLLAVGFTTRYPLRICCQDMLEYCKR
jgi:GDP-4-dehydro-6-deoxy-D-mannose reductase